jgi:3-hydroxyisobutyrate dehydrogenase-like beta-hydroxyacid dehydrogenase
MLDAQRPAAAPARIGFIGFGEVGQTFARGLLATPGVGIAAWDILFGAAAGHGLRAAARTLGVSAADSAAALIAGADIVISAVTADRTEEVAAEAARFLHAGQIFLDVNSAAPSTKRSAAMIVQSSGADYVEGAVMAAVRKPGIQVPILAGGPAAPAAAEWLNRLGMNLTPVAAEYGRASAMKLCRSILIKGLEALMIECAAAADEWEVRREVFDSLAATFPSIDWPALAADMRERVETHGMRRAAEMREAAAMLAALGRDAGLALAIADVQQRHAAPKRVEVAAPSL